jgi:predicted RNA-binding protein associated with RNAse of E/G family
MHLGPYAVPYAVQPGTITREKTRRERQRYINELETARRNRQRQHAIDNVMERLDVFGVCLVSMRLLDSDDVDQASRDAAMRRYGAIRKQQAMAIVDAVLALTKE